VNRIECATPAGAQTALCGGATHEPCSVQTESMPLVAYTNCPHGCACAGSCTPSSNDALTDRIRKNGSSSGVRRFLDIHWHDSGIAPPNTPA
jgi:hypothetical protein